MNNSNHCLSRKILSQHLDLTPAALLRLFLNIKTGL